MTIPPNISYNFQWDSTQHSRVVINPDDAPNQILLIEVSVLLGEIDSHRNVAIRNNS